MSDTRPLDVDCPRCREPAGSLCTGAVRNMAARFHKARWRRAELGAVSPAAMLDAQRAAIDGLRAELAAKDKRIEELERELSTHTERRFPIMGGPSIPWSVIAPWDDQARRNHGSQSLERLAQRGGLGPSEAVAVLLGQRWTPDHEVRAKERLLLLVEERRCNVRAEAAEARVEELEAALRIAHNSMDSENAEATCCYWCGGRAANRGERGAKSLVHDDDCFIGIVRHTLGLDGKAGG